MLGFAEHPWCHPAALRAAGMTALRETPFWSSLAFGSLRETCQKLAGARGPDTLGRRAGPVLAADRRRMCARARDPGRARLAAGLCAARDPRRARRRARERSGECVRAGRLEWRRSRAVRGSAARVGARSGDLLPVPRAVRDLGRAPPPPRLHARRVLAGARTARRS